MSLQTLLDEGAAHDAEYRGGLSNHRPMALVALRRLGASDERLAAFAQHYSPRLQPAPPAVPWPAGDAWQLLFGERDAWPTYRDLFTQWLQHEGGAAVLSQALPSLMPGCGAAAFHGLIRTAYAVQAGHGPELADALAYWACRWLDLGRATPGGRLADPARLLAALHPAPAQGSLIFERMRQVAVDPAFDAAVARLRIDGDTLPRLARAAARLYARSGNFTALHLVTSAQALRVLLPFADELLPALAGYWRAYAAGWLASGAVAGRAPAPLPWPDLVTAALASDDAHLIKLVDACREEQQAYGGADDWQRAATRVVLAGP